MKAMPVPRLPAGVGAVVTSPMPFPLLSSRPGGRLAIPLFVPASSVVGAAVTDPMADPTCVGASVGTSVSVGAAVTDPMADPISVGESVGDLVTDARAVPKEVGSTVGNMEGDSEGLVVG